MGIFQDEQFRVNGRETLGGWMWISSTFHRRFVELPQKPPLKIFCTMPKEQVALAFNYYHCSLLLHYIQTANLLISAEDKRSQESVSSRKPGQEIEHMENDQ
jgi:hypothetical protein